MLKYIEGPHRQNDTKQVAKIAHDGKQNTGKPIGRAPVQWGDFYVSTSNECQDG